MRLDGTGYEYPAICVAPPGQAEVRRFDFPLEFQNIIPYQQDGMIVHIFEVTGWKWTRTLWLLDPHVDFDLTDMSLIYKPLDQTNLDPIFTHTKTYTNIPTFLRAQHQDQSCLQSNYTASVMKIPITVGGLLLHATLHLSLTTALALPEDSIFVERDGGEMIAR